MRPTVVGRRCLAAVGAVAALTLAGCGGSSTPGTSTGPNADPALKMAQCMRAHGVPNFPDPTTTPPTSRAQRGALALGRGGLFLLVADPDAPAFKHAADMCHFPMPHLPSG